MQDTPMVLNFSLDTLWQSVIAIVNYLGKTVFPFNQSVYPLSRPLFSKLGAAISLSLFFILKSKDIFLNRQIAIFGVLTYFLLLIIPVVFTSTQTNGVDYERRLYTSFIGLTLLLTQVKAAFSPSGKKLSFKFVLYLQLKLLCAQMCIQIKISFINAGLKERSDNCPFYVQKAELLYRSGKTTEALQFQNAKNDFNTAI